MKVSFLSFSLFKKESRKKKKRKKKKRKFVLFSSKWTITSIGQGKKKPRRRKLSSFHRNSLMFFNKKKPHVLLSIRVCGRLEKSTVTLEGTSRKGKLSFFRATRKSFARPNPTFFEFKKGIATKEEKKRERIFFYFFLPWIDVSKW